MCLPDNIVVLINHLQYLFLAEARVKALKKQNESWLIFEQKSTSYLRDLYPDYWVSHFLPADVLWSVVHRHR